MAWGVKGQDASLVFLSAFFSGRLSYESWYLHFGSLSLSFLQPLNLCGHFNGDMSFPLSLGRQARF